MEKYGFIYEWHDKKRDMKYIGCHWGTEDDGYVCSSNRMRDAYRRRPQDFSKIILKTYIPKESLLVEEYKWLKQIPNEELGVKYYNLKNTIFPNNIERKMSSPWKGKISSSVKKLWEDPEYRDNQINEIMHNTNYTKTEAIEKLIIFNNNENNVIRNYLGIVEKPTMRTTSINQELYRQIRLKMDKNIQEYNIKKELEEKTITQDKQKTAKYISYN